MTFVYLICFLLLAVGAILLLKLTPERITGDLMRFVSPKQTLRDKVLTRKGVMTTEQEMSRLNAFVTPLILQGQSIHQIYVNYADTLMCSEKTLYNYIDHGFFDARNIDLPRKVRYRPRKKEQEFKVDRGCYVGRNYVDYQQFLLKHPNAHTVQMDSVIGTVGGKVLLTIHFPETSFWVFLLGIIRKQK